MSRAKARAERVPGDAYLTPDNVARACVACLLRDDNETKEDPRYVIEPSVGDGAFARAMRVAWPGVKILGIDIDPNATGFADCDSSVCCDWLTAGSVNGADLICGNPPYGRAQEHIERAFTQTNPLGTVAMLLRLNFLEGQARAAFWKRYPFDECFVLSARPSFTGGGTDATAYAFFVWRTGSARKDMHWIFPPESEPGDQPMPPKKSRKKITPAITVATAPLVDVATVPAPWIEAVQSNVKSDTWPGWTVRFDSPKVLIVGHNGAGKSRIANALELALSGRATDVVGRDPKAPAELAALAPPGQGELFARATWTIGSPTWRTASWSMGIKHDGSASKPHWSAVGANVNTADLLPVRALEEALHGSADGARSFFLNVIADRIGDADVLARLPSAFHPAWQTLLTQGNSTVSRLLQKIDHAKVKAREYKAEQRNADIVIQSIGERLHAQPTESQLAELTETIEQLSATINGLETQARFIQAHVARAVLPVWMQAVANIAAPVVFGVPDHSATIALLESAATIAQTGIDKHLSTCPICAQGVSAYTYADTRDRARAMIDELRAASQPPTLQLAVVEVNGFTYGIDVARQYVAQLAAQTLLGVDIGPEPAGPPELWSTDTLTAERDRLARVRQETVTNLSTMRADIGRWADVSRARDRSADAARQIDEWDRTVAAFSAVRDELIASAVDVFTGEVDKYLPTGDAFGLRLNDDAGREVFQMGLIRAGVPGGLPVFHAALSGAEELRVLSALAAVCSGGRGVVIPRERAHDAGTLGEAMRALVAAPGQIILTSTVLPEGSTDGWQVIDVATIGNEVVDAQPEMDEPPTFDNEDELPWGYSTEGEA